MVTEAFQPRFMIDLPYSDILIRAQQWIGEHETNSSVMFLLPRLVVDHPPAFLLRMR